MKKISRFLVSLFLVMLIVLPAFSATNVMPSKNHAGLIGENSKAWSKAFVDYLYLKGDTAYYFLFSGTPSANRTYTLPDKSGTIAMTSDVSTAAPAINAVTGAAADTTIAFTAYQGTFTSTLTNKDMFTFQGLGAFGDVSVMKIEQKTGNATDGTVLEVVSADANVDPLVVSSSGQAGVLTVGQGGTVDIIGATTITGAFTETGAATIGNGTAGVAINSSVWDITAAGAASGLTTLSLSDDITVANGKGVKPSSTTAETIAIKSYDVDGGAYVNSILLTNGNTPAVAIGSGVETVAINSSDWDISTSGAITGVASVTYDSGSTIQHASISCNNACIKALRASPKELVATPGAGYYIEMLSAQLILNYGTNVLTESTDNLVIEYGTSGQDATAAIETTGFIDQAADQMAFILPQTIATVAAASVANNNLRLFNTGDGEFAGNAGNDTVMTIKIAYRVHPTGL